MKKLFSNSLTGGSVNYTFSLKTRNHNKVEAKIMARAETQKTVAQNELMAKIRANRDKPAIKLVKKLIP